MVAELLPCVNIADMHLNARDLDSRDRVPDSIAVMRKCSCVDYNAVKAGSRGMELINDSSFVVRLKNLALKSLLLSAVDNISVEDVDRRAAVNSRLALAEEIKIWAMYNKNIFYNSKISFESFTLF